MRAHADALVAPTLSPVLSAAFPSTGLVSAAASHVRATFSVSGLADAGLLPRVLEPVAKLGLVPDQVTAGRALAADGTDFTVALALLDVSPRHAQLVELALRAIVGVRTVVATIEATSSPASSGH